MRWFRRKKKAPTPAQEAIAEAKDANKRTDRFTKERARPALEELEGHLQENGFSRILADAYRPRHPRPGGAR